MRRPLGEPARLSDLRLDDDPENLCRMVRVAAAIPTDVPRLKSRLRYSLNRRSAWRRPLSAAFLGGVLLLVGGVMGAVAQPILHLWEAWRGESSARSYPAAPAAGARRRGTSMPTERPSAATPAPAPMGPEVPGMSSTITATPGPASPEADQPASMGSAPALRPSQGTEPIPFQTKPAAVRSGVGVAVPAATRWQPRWSAGPSLPGATIPQRPEQVATLDSPSVSVASASSTVPPAFPSWPSRPLAVPADTGTSTSQRPDPIPVARPAPIARPAVVQAPVAQPGVVVPPTPSEQALLARAIRSLRSERRPASALAVLDEYAARFPRGGLSPEANRLRAEALLALGDKPAALAELNRELVPVGTSEEESRLVRGELRASAGRWHDALEDFDAAVRGYQAAAATASAMKLHERLERALWGRASVRSHLRDEAGARADLLEYLRRYPHGRFAVRAAHLLGQLH